MLPNGQMMDGKVSMLSPADAFLSEIHLREEVHEGRHDVLFVEQVHPALVR